MILIGVVFVLGLYLVFSSRDHSESYEKIVVGEGQTLWNIADRYAESGTGKMSRQEFIQWVEKHNVIDGNVIQAGEKIVIPVKKQNSLHKGNKEIAFK